MHSWSKQVLVLGAALLLVSAAVVAVGVIPPVRADTFPLAAPDRAVPAFWGTVILNSLAAVMAFTSFGLGSGRAILARASAAASGFVALLLGLLLVDAAASLSSHGPGMRGAAVALWVCVGLDLVAGLMMIAAAFARARRTPGLPRS